MSVVGEVTQRSAELNPEGSPEEKSQRKRMPMDIELNSISIPLFLSHRARSI